MGKKEIQGIKDMPLQQETCSGKVNNVAHLTLHTTCQHMLPTIHNWLSNIIQTLRSGFRHGALPVMLIEELINEMKRT